MRGATDRRGQRQLPDVISIRAPHAGSDSAMISDIHRGIKFQSALPLRGATGLVMMDSNGKGFQSALPLRGATAGLRRDLLDSRISIRAPLAGSDGRAARCSARRRNFNPRSPCGERRGIAGRRSLAQGEFQSALPLRGATRLRSFCAGATRYFNPRSPCGERRQAWGTRP